MFVLLIAVNGAAAAGLQRLGVDLLPRTAAAPSVPQSTAAKPAAAPASLPPAAAVLAVLDEPLASLRGLASSDVGAASGWPTDRSCGPVTVAAALARSVGVAGSPDTGRPEGGSGAIVTVRVFGAGGGGAVMDELQSRARNCRSAGWSPARGPGTQAAVLQLGSASTLVWRRGDVVASASVYGPAAPAAAAVAVELDQRLEPVLSGRCLDQDSVPADALRSPYVAGPEFAGRLVEQVVRADARDLEPPPPLTDPTAASDPAEPELFSVPDPLPSPPLPLPPVDLPSTPALPELPVEPSANATERAVPVRTPDPDGPGCGWAFLGQRAPVFDAAAASTRQQQLVAQAHADFRIEYLDYLERRSSYQGLYVEYARMANSYARWVTLVQQAQVDYDLANPTPSASPKTSSPPAPPAAEPPPASPDTTPTPEPSLSSSPAPAGDPERPSN